jgi:hypothetical protein
VSAEVAEVRALGRRAPRSAGVAGIAFSVLFVASIIAATFRPPDGLDEAGLVDWFQGSSQTWITISALYLVPFAGITFLWFIGVVRDRIGAHEDQFFATVLLGSGLLFVAMYWSSAALMASLVAGNSFDASPPLTADRLEAVRSQAFSFMFVLAARAAAVFMLVASTITRRSGVFPRPLVTIGYVIGLVMLFGLSFMHLIVLLFPAWVFVVSLYLLRAENRAGRSSEAVGPPA